MLDYLIVIPARYKSSRFPGKPLKKIMGKEMILHVLERCSLKFDRQKILVATDSIKIKNFLKKKSYKAVMTSEKCLTGTDRVAEIAKKINSKIYINVQGDEPLIDPMDIWKVLLEKKKYKKSIICGMTKINKHEKPTSNSIPKVVFDKYNKLIYISRSLIPGSKNKRRFKFWKQVCIYGFSKDDLKIFGKNKRKSELEKIEDIEILRFIDNQKIVKMVKTKEGSIAVDYRKDIKIVEKILKKRNAK